MTSAALSFGCGFIAFSIPAALLLFLTYQKAQLIILVTTSAFAYLLSALVQALVWLPFSKSSISNNVVLIVIPGVIVQCLFRCGFVIMYQKVESVVKKSVARHESHINANRRLNNNDNSDTNVPESETARLNLELNDASCGLAAATGFGGMHSLLLYGTLLSSEGGNGGTLYQPSCSAMPSLVSGALIAFLFTILDAVWMLLTFYAVRRRKLPHYPNTAPIHSNSCCNRFAVPNDAKGAKIALGVVLLSHSAASFATAFNDMNNGCVISLPVLAVIMVLTVVFFSVSVMNHYLPTNSISERNQLDSQRTSAGANGTLTGGIPTCAQGGGNGQHDQFNSYHED
uniref:Uncharacterized protein n=1 Tax=Ditylum brightwellii TaxID=49249 RepID=A0A7S1ZJJ0_9STRA